jgi:hypothetical protein
MSELVDLCLQFAAGTAKKLNHTLDDTTMILALLCSPASPIMTRGSAVSAAVHRCHTYALLKLTHGENRLFVAKQLGYATPEMTIRRYARFTRRVPGPAGWPTGLGQI